MQDHWMLAAHSLIFHLRLLLICCCYYTVFSRLNQTTSLTVVIHVGPHKTGSTHVQSSLLSLDDLIQKRTNYMQPFVPGDTGLLDPKMQSLISGELQNLGTTNFRYLNQLKIFLQKAHQQLSNVLMSSEEFSSIPPDGASYLSNMLRNFKAKVVFTFRDSLSRALSDYHETYPRHALSDKVHLPDFRVFVHRNLNSLRVHYQEVLDLYAKEFGAESLVLIDYDGAIVAKKDLVCIILCEICKTLCEDLSQGLDALLEREHLLMKGGSNHADKHPPLLLAGVISEIRVSIQKQKCTILVASHDKIKHFILNMIINKQMLPSMTNNLSTMFHNESLMGDDMIRKKYKSQILYENRDASIAAVERQVVTELDFDRFRSDPYWQKWTHDVTSSLINSTMIAC